MPIFVKTDKQGRIPARSVTVVRGRGGEPRRIRIEVPRANVAHGMTLGTGRTRKFIPFRSYKGSPSADYDESYDAAYRKRRGGGKRKAKARKRRRRPVRATRKRSSSTRRRRRR